MMSLIIESNDESKREAFALQYIYQQGIDPLDILRIDKDTFEKKSAKKENTSIGIEGIRTAYSTLFLKPVKSPLKAVLIINAQLLTHEAQNALLKVLEEPPQSTQFILTVDTIEALLPTIHSRCKIEHISVTRTLYTEEREELKTLFSSIKHMAILDALQLAEALSKNKNESIHLLEKMLLYAHEELISSDSIASITSDAKLIRSLQETHLLLKTTNVNIRLALESLFLSMLP